MNKASLSLLVLAALSRICGSAPPAAALDAERHAAATLRKIHAAQLAFRSAGWVDLDGDSIGHFGWLAELAGAVPVTGGSTPVPPPAPLPSAFGKIDPNGFLPLREYFYVMYLPDGVGAPVSEKAGGGDPGGIWGDASERAFACYAWPKNLADGPLRALVINQEGVVLVTDGAVVAYDGTASVPYGDSAYLYANDLTGPLAKGVIAMDGNTWMVAR